MRWGEHHPVQLHVPELHEGLSALHPHSEADAGGHIGIESGPQQCGPCLRPEGRHYRAVAQQRHHGRVNEPHASVGPIDLQRSRQQGDQSISLIGIEGGGKGLVEHPLLYRYDDLRLLPRHAPSCHVVRGINITFVRINDVRPIKERLSIRRDVETSVFRHRELVAAVLELDMNFRFVDPFRGHQAVDVLQAQEANGRPERGRIYGRQRQGLGASVGNVTPSHQGWTPALRWSMSWMAAGGMHEHDPS